MPGRDLHTRASSYGHAPLMFSFVGRKRRRIVTAEFPNNLSGNEKALEDRTMPRARYENAPRYLDVTFPATA